MRWLYSLLLFLSLPFVFIRLYIKGAKNPQYRQRWKERLGIIAAPKNKSDKTIWIHAVSVGEVEASIPLVKHLFSSFSDLQIVITTTTPTGAEAVARRLLDPQLNPNADQVRHYFIAYDLISFQQRFINTIKPQLLIIMETEIWPNLISLCNKKQIPVLLANARMSERSRQGYTKLGKFSRNTFSSINQIAAQTELDAHRLITLGAKAEHLSVTGSLKFDQIVSDTILEQGIELRKKIGPQRAVWIAASTHPGEEEKIIIAHQQIVKTLPDCLLILVPRHPERFDLVFQLCEKNKLKTNRRSMNQNIDGQVYLFDSMGELLLAYGVADIAFVAGSLEPIGGHNFLEASSLGIPVIMGPHTFKIEKIFQTFLDSDAVIRINDTNELADKILYLLENQRVRSAIATRATDLLEKSRGSTERHIALIKHLI